MTLNENRGTRSSYNDVPGLAQGELSWARKIQQSPGSQLYGRAMGTCAWGWVYCTEIGKPLVITPAFHWY